MNAQNQTYYNPSYDKPENEPDFFKEVSEDGIKRFMSILDELFKAVEKLGGSVNDDLSIKIRSDIVRIRVAEAKDKIKHELTKQEAQALLKYEDEIKRHSWASKPQIVNMIMSIMVELELYLERKAIFVILRKKNWKIV